MTSSIAAQGEFSCKFILLHERNCIYLFEDIFRVNPPVSPVAVECGVWRAAAGCRPMTEQAFAVWPLKSSGPDEPAPHSHL